MWCIWEEFVWLLWLVILYVTDKCTLFRSITGNLVQAEIDKSLLAVWIWTAIETETTKKNVEFLKQIE